MKNNRNARMNDQAKQSLKIVSTGTWLSSSNVGDNAIYSGLLDTFPRAEFTVLTSDPSRVREVYQVRAFSPKKQPLRTLLSIIKADYVLFTGGTPLFDDPVHMAYFASLAVTAWFSRVPVVIFGVSYRKAKGLSLTFIKLILRLAAFAGAREMVTLQEFQALVKNPDKVKFFPDPGYFMNPQGLPASHPLTEKLATRAGSKVIGICLRSLAPSGDFQEHHYSKKYSEEMLRSFYQHLAEFVEHVVTADGAHVIFLPMHIHLPDDDRIAANQVMERIDDQRMQESITFVAEQLQPREMKWVFSKLDVVLGVRFHSIVLATSVNTPVISVEYARKNRDLLALLELSHYSTPVEDVTAENLVERYERLKEEYVVIQDHLKQLNQQFRSAYLSRVQNLFPG